MNNERIDQLTTALKEITYAFKSMEWEGTRFYDARCCLWCAGLAPTEAGLAERYMETEKLGHRPECYFVYLLNQAIFQEILALQDPRDTEEP